MANVMTRRLFIRNVQKIKEFSTLAAYPCMNICVAKQNRKVSPFRSKYEFKITVLYLPKEFNLGYYSTNARNDGKVCDGKECDENDNKDNKANKLTLLQKFKLMYRDYWYVLLPVHILTSSVWFGTFYYMAKSGIDIITLLESLHVSEKFVNPLRDSSMGYFAIAYALYKIATPARYTVTLGGTTVAINYLKKWGYIKPVPSKERMKQIIQEKKETLSKTVHDTKEGIVESKENLMETMRETKEGIAEKKQNIMNTFQDAKEEIMETKNHLMGSTKDAKKKLKHKNCNKKDNTKPET